MPLKNHTSVMSPAMMPVQRWIQNSARTRSIFDRPRVVSSTERGLTLALNERTILATAAIQTPFHPARLVRRGTDAHSVISRLPRDTSGDHASFGAGPRLSPWQCD